MTSLLTARAVLFDLDGVLTPTAVVHERAWRALFEQAFARFDAQPPYTEADYLAHVDGRPRFEGVRAVLADRGIDLPPGSTDDAPSFETVCGMGNLKNELFLRSLAEDGVVAYPGSVALLDALAAAGVPCAVVSSSRNARGVLAAAGLAARFEVVVDGVVAAGLGLAGKPAPDTYLHAAELLGAPPASTAVIEDALSGVASGAAGGFHPVVGVDRGAGRAALRAAGAEIVVDDLAELIDGAPSSKGDK